MGIFPSNFPQQQQMVLKVFGFYIIWRLLRGGFGAGVRWGNGNKKGKKGLFPSCLWLFADNWQLIVI